ncbi:MAG TPA: FHA domain-containing protein [Isosphaeraceae bacterium]|jgi:predicted component of type VI protein secretion system|nr:FHA domain-containing protein [Isosphaeraceae bacterium]
MKAQLIVVQGKPEGKVIPLVGPVFKVGRNPDCHLRPQSEQVSREHAEFAVGPDQVTLRDLGSRNGTFVNGKSLSGTVALQNGDLVQIGHLTFAVSIQGAAAAAAPDRPAPARVGQPTAADDATHDEIDQWLVADSSHTPPETPSGVYGGDTMTLNAFKTIPKPDAAEPAAPEPPAAEPAAPEPPAAAAAKPAAPAPVAAKPAPPAASPGSAPAPAARSAAAQKKSFLDEIEDFEHLPEGQGDAAAEDHGGGGGDYEGEAEAGDEEAAAEVPEEFIDESNPFYAKKKEEEAGPVKPSYKDSSDAAQDILRKMMERRRASKSS